MTVEVALEDDTARELMYDQCVEVLPEEFVDGKLEEAVKGTLKELYDNRDEVAEQIEQQR